MRSSRPSSEESTARRPFWPVAVLSAYDAIGYGLVGPVLPALRARADATSLEASVIFAGFAVGMLVGFALAGVAIRRTGPRSAALAGVGLHIAGDLLFILGHSPGIYLAARMAQGLGSGALWMASTFTVLSWWPERPGPKLGRMLSSYAVGSVLGPLLAALGGAVLPFAGDLALASAGLVAAASMPARHGRTFNWGLAVLRDRRLAFGSLVALLEALLFAALEGSYTLRFSDQLSQRLLGLLIALTTVAFGLGAALPAAGASGIRGRRASQTALVVCAAAVLALGGSSVAPLWFGAAVVLGLALGVTETGAVSMVAATPEESMLTAMTAASQAFAVGYLIGAPLATWLTEWAGNVWSAVVLACAALATAAAAYAVPVSRPRRTA
ncbi:MAG TPA: MFS transporter [Actinomycetota bacterium]|nr:MFS transporter [Actinomycetota bacterium]